MEDNATIGVKIEIPDDVETKLKGVETAINGLQEAAKQTEKVVNEQFAKMGMDVKPFLDALEKSKTSLGELMKLAQVSDTQENLKKSKSEAEKLAEALSKANAATEMIGKGGNIAELKKAIKDISNYLEKGKGASDALEEKRLVNARQTLKEMLKQREEVQRIISDAEKLEKITDRINSTKSRKLDPLNIADLKKSIKEINEVLSKEGGIEDANQQRELVRLRERLKEKLKMQQMTEDQIEEYKEKKRNKELAAERRLAAEKKRLARERIPSYGEAMSMEDKSINQRIAKINALKKVRDNLSSSEEGYKQKLKALNDEIKKNVALNNQATDSMTKKSSSLMNVTQQMARRAALVFSVSQINGYLNKLVEVRGQFELQAKSLEVILQNKEQADRLFTQITELAVQSPFQLKELVTYTKQLAAYRVEEEKLFDTTKMLADVSAGLSVDMNRLILAYGQVKAANYLRGTELRQFSEAGVNILGELADYFTEIEGRAVSVGQVFERVSKRMVSFQDVDKIFKRITSEGGIFFKMQEQQAETLAGQISNLRDSIDIMLNDIGKANDGALKGIVAAIRSFVENWETFAVILKTATAAWGFYRLSLLAAAKQTVYTTSILRPLAASMMEVGGSVSFTTRGITGLRLAFVKLSNVLKINPFVLLATMVTGSVFAINKYKDAIEEVRAKYDSLSISVEKSSERIRLAMDKFDGQGESIKKAKEELAKYKEGSKEYAAALDVLNTAQKTQDGYIESIKRKYPELLKYINSQKDGVIDLKKAAEEYNKELEQTLTLNALMKDDVGFFGTDIISAYEKLNKSQKNYDKGLRSLKTGYQVSITKLKELAATNDEFSNKYIGSIRNIDKSGDSVVDKYKKISRLITEIDELSIGGKANSAFENARDAFYTYSKYALSYNLAMKDAESHTNELIDDFLTMNDITEEEFRKMDDRAKKIALRPLEETLRSIPSMTEESMQKVAQKAVDVRLNIVPSFVDYKNVDLQMSALRKAINSYIEKNKMEISLIKYDEETEKYFDKLNADLKDTEKNIKRLNSEGAKSGGENATKEIEAELEGEKKKLKELKSLLEAFDALGSDKKKGGSSNNVWKERIDLIKKAGEKFAEYNKNVSSDEAAKRVRQDFKEAFSKDTQIGDIYASMSFDPSGIEEAIELVGKRGGDVATKYADKVLAEYRGKDLIKGDILDTKSIEKEIDNLFAQFDFYKEIEKAGWDKDAVEELFGIRPLNLDELKSEINTYRLILGKLGTEQVKVFEEANNKVKNIEDKDRVQRMKKYVDWLKKAEDERIKIELETEAEIAKIKKDKMLDVDVKNDLIKKVRENADKELKSLDFKDFKGSDIYIEMFEDLENASDVALETMLKKLESLRESLKDIDPSDLKEIADRINKIQDEIESRNPFRDFSKNLKEYIQLLGMKNDLERQYSDSSKKEESIKASIKKQREIVLGKKREWQEVVKIHKIGSKEEKLAKKKYKLSKAVLDSSKEELETQEKVTKNLWEQLKTATTLGEKLSKSFYAASNYSSQIQGAISSLSESFEQIFGNMSDKGKDTVDTISEIVGGLGQISEGVGDIVSGKDVVGGAIKATTGLFASIASIFRIKDKRNERKIKKEIKAVAELDRAYRHLKDSIAAAYSFDTLKKSNEEAISLIDRQIASYEEMIRLEDDKKKTDDNKIIEWQETIDQLKTEREQLQKDFIASVGGFGDEDSLKSAAEAFVDAWYNAYMEVGDGLDGLQNNFDEFLKNALKKQLLMKLSNEFVTPILESFDKMFGEDSLGGAKMTKEELDTFKELFDVKSKEFDEKAKAYLKALGITPDFESADAELSGLQKGIQSVTETTAQALEALLNSMRFFVSDSNIQLKAIKMALTSQDAVQNPILNELKNQTRAINNINSILESITKMGHPLGGAFVKVSM